MLLGVDHLKAIFEEDLSNYTDTSSLIEHLRTRCVRRTATHSHAQPRTTQHATWRRAACNRSGTRQCHPNSAITSNCCLSQFLRCLAPHPMLMQLSRSEEPASSGSGVCDGTRYCAHEAHKHLRVHACTDVCTHTHQHTLPHTLPLTPTRTHAHARTRTHAHPCMRAATGGHTWHTSRAQRPMTTDSGR